jgi:hypothetical protein
MLQQQLTRIVGGLAGDVDAVRMAFAQSGIGNFDHTGLAQSF